MTDATLPLAVRDVHFAYRSVQAVSGVSFEVRPGEVFGLLGPNGAGKTTTISMIAGLLAPGAGQVLVFGETAGSPKARARLGVVPQEVAVYDELTVSENVRFFGRLFALSGAALEAAVASALAKVGLSERARERVDGLSGGLKRRLNLAVGLVHAPDLLVLDEPTVGIDPQARLGILEVVKEQARSGRAVLYTSHYLEEAEQLCDRLAIVDHGRVLAAGTVDELRRRVGEGPVVRIRAELSPEGAQEVAARCEGTVLLTSLDGVTTFSARDEAACSSLVRELFRSATRLDDIRIQEPNLQSLFLKLTGRELRD